MFKQMITNLKKNLKNNKNISSLFNYDSNPSVKSSSTMEDFMDITEELIGHDYQEKKQLLKEFIENIVSIIFESRKEKTNNEFSLNTSKNSEISNNDFDNKSFNPELDDLFLYNDFYQDKNVVQKFVIEFYLIKKQGDKKIKELVEKWKLTYSLNKDNNEPNNNQNILSFKNKINIYTKSIISYTRLLPLYQFNHSIKDKNDYFLDFKFYQNKSKIKGKFSEKPSGNVIMKNSDLFNFKLNIKYYNLNELKNIFEQNEENEDIYKHNKIRSLSLHKTKFNLKGFESINELSNDNNPINNINNDEKFIKTCNTEINNDKIKEINSESNNSSFCLVLDCQEEDKKICDENNNIKNEEKTKKKERKCSFFSNPEEVTEDCTPRNSNSKYYYRTSEKSNEENASFISKRKTFMKTENDKINKILKEYSSIKDMIENLNSSINIDTDLFIKYSKGCD